MNTQVLSDHPQPALQPLLGSIVCTLASPEEGESVCIEVRDANGVPYREADVPISINGVAGARHWVQWNRAGTRTVIVVGRRPGGSQESMNATVVVRPAAADAKRPRLRVTWSLEKPTVAQFLVVYPSTPRLPITLADKTAAPTAISGAAAAKAAGAPARSRGTQPKAGAVPDGRTTTSAAAKNTGGAVKPIYTFDFGDGTSLGTVHPGVEHDYGPSLDAQREHGLFHVAVTVQNPGGKPLTIRRTVCVLSLHHLAKQGGVLRPPLVRADFSAVFVDVAHRASFTVHNPDKTELILTRRRIELMFADSNRMEVFLAPETVHVSLPAGRQTKIDVTVPAAHIPPNAIGFAAHYEGTVAGEQRVSGAHKVRVSAYFDIPEHMKNALPRLDPAWEVYLNDLAKRKLLPNPKSITLTEIETLAARKLIAPPPVVKKAAPSGRVLIGGERAALTAFRPALLPAAPKPRSHHVDPPPAVEGQECHPDNLPDAVPEGLVCQATEEQAWVAFPGRFMNARKGDVVLPPSNGSLIGEMMARLQPPQHYSHSGIMTRNRDEITHSTASTERLMAHPNGSIGGTPAPSDGFVPSCLRYLWPGSITQTIEDAVHGEWMNDPEAGPGGQFHSFLVKGFDSLEYNEIIDGEPAKVYHAVVVKPDPVAETENVRNQLHGIADWAAQHVGKSHYSFYSYTDPTTGLKNFAPTVGWATGTFPSVCSSYVWMAALRANVQLEGPLDPEKGTMDGLDLYRADERLKAGERMFELLRQKVAEVAADKGILGELGSAVADMADDVGNQVLNAFAYDNCETAAKDSDAWRNTSDASAVSADDIMRWDAPLYGAHEPLVYFPPRYEYVTVHRWRKVILKGKLHGHVTFRGKAVAGAQVQLYDGKFTHTGGSGEFTLADVPAGKYTCEVQKIEPNGLYLSVSKDVNIGANKTTDATFELTGPSDLYRKIVINGFMGTTDYELLSAVDPHAEKDIYAALMVGPYSTHAEAAPFDCVADIDVLGRIIFTADWQVDKSVKINMIARCFDGTQPTDSFEEGIVPFTVAPDTAGNWNIIQHNGGDHVHGWVTVSNEVQNVGTG